MTLELDLRQTDGGRTLWGQSCVWAAGVLLEQRNTHTDKPLISSAVMSAQTRKFLLTPIAFVALAIAVLAEHQKIVAKWLHPTVQYCTITRSALQIALASFYVDSRQKMRRCKWCHYPMAVQYSISPDVKFVVCNLCSTRLPAVAVPISTCGSLQS